MILLVSVGVEVEEDVRVLMGVGRVRTEERANCITLWCLITPINHLFSLALLILHSPKCLSCVGAENGRENCLHNDCLHTFPLLGLVTVTLNICFYDWLFAISRGKILPANTNKPAGLRFVVTAPRQATLETPILNLG